MPKRPPATTEPRAAAGFSARLLRWHARSGRHDLPWQHPRTPWRVWLSEIMLQQTQVATVIPYFERFVARFPDVRDLAAASEDDVLALWAGLGYYARARNLHRAAQRVVAEHGGEVPADYDALCALPGIGASTAAAICAQAFGQRHAILDANVKRVLARHAGVEGWPGRTLVARCLQTAADARLPRTRLADYTQAIMDLGAGVCLPRAPRCGACPVSEDCFALSSDSIERLPTPKPRRAKPERHGFLLLLRHPRDGRLWLERRAPVGIWGGLWAPPIIASLDEAAVRGIDTDGRPAGDMLSHSFTHFTWHLQPVAAHFARGGRVAESTGAWHTMDTALQRGLPAPVRRFLTELAP